MLKTLSLAGLLLMSVPAVALADEAMPQAAQMDPAQMLLAAQKDLQTRAEAAQGQRFSYAMNVTNKGKKNFAFTLAYDPNGEDGKKWHIVSPQKDVDEQSWKVAEDQLASMAKQREKNPDAEPSDQQMIADDLPGDDASIYTYLRTDNGYAVYGFDPARTDLLSDDDEEDDNKMAQYVKGELGLVAATGAPAWVRIYAPKPFKPAPIAKLDQFMLSFSITQAWDNGPWVISAQDTVLSGSAMFKKFSADSKVRFTDFQPVATGE